MNNYIERKDKLISQIEKAKNQIEKLRNKRVNEIGQLAMNCGIADLDNITLEEYFIQIAKEQQTTPDE